MSAMVWKRAELPAGRLGTEKGHTVWFVAYPAPKLHTEIVAQVVGESMRQSGWVARIERSNMLIMPASWWGPKE